MFTFERTKQAKAVATGILDNVGKRERILPNVEIKNVNEFSFIRKEGGYIRSISFLRTQVGQLCLY